MKILITGASGFIGKHLLCALANDEVEVRIISRQSNLKFDDKIKQPEIIQADISDSAVLENAFEDIDVVINLAAEVRNPENFEKTNVQGVHVLANLAKKKNVKKFIHLSSVGVVGRQYSAKNIVVDESAICLPQNGYEKSKLESEKILTEAFSDNRGRLVLLRPTNVFGDEHPRNALLNYFQTIKNGSRFICTNDAMVNYLYVKDLVVSIRHFIFNTAAENIYNVGNAMLFKDFFYESSRMIGSKSPLLILPDFCFAIPEMVGYFGMDNIKVKMRSLSNHVIYSDNRIQKEIPDIYNFGIMKGLQCTIDYYRSTGKL
ncbi:NAD(P)-dependent oxidoreductase [soil metagenome]